MASRNRQLRIVNRIGDWLRGSPLGRIFKHDPTIDSLRAALTKRLTFAKLATILRNADEGQLTDALQLFEEMEHTDPKLFSLATTRRGGFTGLEHEIVSAAVVKGDSVDETLADEAAAYVREHLDGFKGFRTALRYMSTAVGSNLSVLELVWEPGELVDIEPIPSWRLTMNLQESLDIRVITAEEPVYGIVAKSPKFVVHTPNPWHLSPLENSLHRAAAKLWLFKQLSQSDWGVRCELFGMPIRVGTYEKGTLDAEKAELKNMLQNLGSRAWAIKSRAVDLELKESARTGPPPYEPFLNFLNRELGILWLGGNLPSDTTGGTGTFAAASVQDELKDDVRDADIEAEGLTVREQIFKPMVQFQYPGREVPVPYYKRIKPEPIDRIKEAEVMIKGQHIGMDVPEDWARERLEIPKPEGDEKALKPPDAFEEGLNEDVGRLEGQNV